MVAYTTKGALSVVWPAREMDNFPSAMAGPSASSGLCTRNNVLPEAGAAIEPERIAYRSSVPSSDAVSVPRHDFLDFLLAGNGQYGQKRHAEDELGHRAAVLFLPSRDSVCVVRHSYRYYQFELPK